MKKIAFLLPVLLSLFVSYYLYKKNTSGSVTYYLDLVFKEAPICIAFYKNEGTSDVMDLSLIYTNKSPKKSSAEDCLDVILMNTHGSSAFYSLSEPTIIDAYINGDIEIVFSKDPDMLEKQILTLHQMVFDGLFTFGWVTQKLLHVYNHWFAQYINGYSISYDWIDAHYTLFDEIITGYLDEKYMLYSHGIGFTPSLTVNKDDKFINISGLALDISFEKSVENKFQYIVDACRMRPGSKVLDMGGGFGSFPRFAVPLGIHVHSLTISTASFDHLQTLSEKFRSNECGCKDNKSKDKCECGSLTATLKNLWELKNTELGRSMAGTFDAMICVGSIEHVPYYDKLMKTAEYYLKPGGYLHVDGFATKIGYTTNYFLQKYIFPGESAPLHMSAYLKAWENSDFLMVGVHCDREDGAKSWYYWAKNFERMVRNESHPVTKKISQKSVKIFRLYLWGFVMSLAHPTTPVGGWRVTMQKPVF